MAKRKKDVARYGDRTVAVYRRASYDYELSDPLEAGIELTGSEVRALREHGADLSDAWVDISKSLQTRVRGMRIPVLNHAAFGHDETRARRLLIHTAEAGRMRATAERERMTIIVTKCYFKNNRAKLEIALARGKKKYDKRQSMKEKDATRETRQAIRDGRGGV